MKKITLLLVAVFVTMFTYAGIWVNPLTTGRPINTSEMYLGDKLTTEWYFNFEIGQTSWDASEVGIGQNTDGTTGWDWGQADWYADGSGSNKQIHRNIGGFQFTSTGAWYVVGRARAASTDDWAYADEGTWSDNTTLTASTTDGSCPYFTVLALGNPTPSTSNITSSSVDLSWTQFESRNVMIVRYPTAGTTAEAPVQGTAYTVGATLGTGTIVYNGSDLTYTDTGLSAGTGYTYVFYSENYSYYSAGESKSITTDGTGTSVYSLSSLVKITGANGKISAEFDGIAKVQLYSISGKLIRSENAVNQFTESVNPGIYVLRVNGTTYKVIAK